MKKTTTRTVVPSANNDDFGSCHLRAADVFLEKKHVNASWRGWDEERRQGVRPFDPTEKYVTAAPDMCTAQGNAWLPPRVSAI